MSNYQSKINKAKSMKVLKDIASHIGVSLGNIKDIVKAKNRLTDALAKEQVTIQKERTKHKAKVENDVKTQRRKVSILAIKRNNLIRDLNEKIEYDIFKTTKNLDKASNQLRYLRGENIKINSQFTTNADTEAPLKEKSFKNLRGNNHKALIEQLTNDINNLKAYKDKFSKPDSLFATMINHLLDDYEKGGYLLNNEKQELANEFNKFNYVKQSYFLNQIVDTMKERYRLDDDVDEDLKLKFNNFKNDMIDNINRIM